LLAALNVARYKHNNEDLDIKVPGTETPSFPPADEGDYLQAATGSPTAEQINRLPFCI
jgi:hypothetical protein